MVLRSIAQVRSTLKGSGHINESTSWLGKHREKKHFISPSGKPPRLFDAAASRHAHVDSLPPARDDTRSPEDPFEDIGKLGALSIWHVPSQNMSARVLTATPLLTLGVRSARVGQAFRNTNPHFFYSSSAE